MRFVDDFLLITREPEIARQFLTAVTEGKYIQELMNHQAEKEACIKSHFKTHFIWILTSRRS